MSCSRVRPNTLGVVSSLQAWQAEMCKPLFNSARALLLAAAELLLLLLHLLLWKLQERRMQLNLPLLL
jgi:hypothetical protein